MFVTSVGGAEDLMLIDSTTQKRRSESHGPTSEMGRPGGAGSAGPRHYETKRTCLGPPPPFSSA